MARDEAPRARGASRRLFVAVEVPASAQDALDVVHARWLGEIPGARWVPRANRHLTVRFLGATPEELLDHVADAVRAAAEDVPPFRVAFDACGRFPLRGKPARVLWAGIDDPAGGLVALAGSLAGRLPASFAPEDRPFTAHVTLARMKTAAAVPGWTGTEPEPVGWWVDALTLVESHLGRPGARYQILDRIPLGDVAGPGLDPR